MRFVLLVAGAAVTGALVQSAAIQGTSHTFEAARSLHGNMTNFNVANINPARAYYDFMR
jgi:hypothetical protein